MRKRLGYYTIHDLRLPYDEIGAAMIGAGFATVNSLAQGPVYGGHDDWFLPGLSAFAGAI